MGYFFTSAEVFWQEFVPFFMIYNGIVAVIEYQFLHRFLCWQSFKKSGCLAMLLLRYLLAALCLQLHSIGLAAKMIHFFLLFGMACLGSRRQKKDCFSMSLTASMLIVTVLTLVQGFSAPIMCWFIRLGTMQNGFLFSLVWVLFSCLLLVTIFRLLGNFFLLAWCLNHGIYLSFLYR